MNYQQTLEYLYGMLPMYQRIGQAAFKKDLSNTLRMCEALGNPQEKFRSVHVAGTNGKGSSSHALAAVLQASGYRTGLYTSPHLKHFGERIRLDGQEIPPQEIVDWVATHKALIEAVKPSFFELTVVMAFDFFARQQLDIAIIEVGMGGRLDSTNVITPAVSLITRIGLDHMAFLGNTLPDIAAEKAGIIKKGVPVIISELQTETRAVFKQKAVECNAPIYFAEEHISLQPALRGAWQVMLNGQSWIEEVKPQTEARYFLKNMPGILYTLHELQQQGYDKISPESIRLGLSQMISLTGLKGRWQVLRQKPLLVCDVSHNPDGMEQLMAQLKSMDYEKLFLIIGTVNDKDVNTVLALLPKEAFYYFCQASIPRALAAEDLQKLAASHGLGGELARDVNQAIEKAVEKASENDLILVTGSTFVVAEIDEL